MLTETAARWLLVLHTAIGVAAVGAATHLVLWLRKYLRGQVSRHRAVRRFAWIVVALHAAGFLVGNVVYPTYRVEVRAAFLDDPTAIVAQHDAHERELATVAAREGARPPEIAASGELVRAAAKQGRWFDVKEHWIALGLIAACALALILAFWDPRRDPRAIAPFVVGLAYVVAGTLWLGAIIGVMTATWRAV